MKELPAYKAKEDSSYCYSDVGSQWHSICEQDVIDTYELSGSMYRIPTHRVKKESLALILTRYWLHDAPATNDTARWYLTRQPLIMSTHDYHHLFFAM